jgi:hypothetical protein
MTIRVLVLNDPLYRMPKLCAKHVDSTRLAAATAAADCVAFAAAAAALEAPASCGAQLLQALRATAATRSAASMLADAHPGRACRMAPATSLKRILILMS